MPTRKLLNQGFLVVESKSSLRKLYGRHHDLVERHSISVSHMTTDMFHLSLALPGPFLIQDLSPGCNYVNTTGATSRAGTAYPSGTSEFTPGFQWGSYYSIFSAMCIFCRQLFVLFLLTIVLSLLPRFTDSDYVFGIFKFFWK